MHDMPEEEEALPQRWNVLPWESLQQWYFFGHFFFSLCKISILIVSTENRFPNVLSRSICFWVTPVSFLNQNKIPFTEGILFSIFTEAENIISYKLYLSFSFGLEKMLSDLLSLLILEKSKI